MSLVCLFVVLSHKLNVWEIQNSLSDPVSSFVNCERKTKTYLRSLHDSEWIAIINFFIIMHIEMFLTAKWNFTFLTQLVSFFQTQKAERFCIFNLTKAVFSHAYFYSFYYVFVLVDTWLHFKKK